MSELKILSSDELQDSLCVLIGTRPSIVKMGPLVHELLDRSREFFIIHTGQHYSFEMDGKFFSDLQLPEPEVQLDVGLSCGSYHGQQTAAMLTGIEEALLERRPRMIFVGGDANTNLAGALAARKLGIQVGHVEAGLRSYDWRMPEEHNRVMIDHISEYLFAPTPASVLNLEQDDVRGEVHLVGNTVVDALERAIQVARDKSEIHARLDVEPGKYFLLTVHREENVDSQHRLVSILDSLERVTGEYRKPIIFPAHPRTVDRLERFGLRQRLDRIRDVRLTEPLGYLDFLVLLDQARLVLTDSGGIQEESCILKTPCVTLRDNTERPETTAVGANITAGVESNQVIQAISSSLEGGNTWQNPFGDGKAAERIIDVSEGSRPEPPEFPAAVSGVQSELLV